MSEGYEAPKPGPLPFKTTEEVTERARRIIQHRGDPPYGVASFDRQPVTAEEAEVLTEFATWWRPLL